jgi:hypothetical protein
MRRDYALASLPALGLSLATGCGPDPLVGTWDLSTLTVGEETYNLPISYYSEGYTYGYAFNLEVVEGDAGLSADLQLVYTFEGPEADESETESYAIAVTVEAKRSYTLVGDALGGAFTLTCAVDGDALACDGTHEGDAFAFDASRAAE